MNLKLVSIIFLLVISVRVSGQTQSEINKTDDQGRKQGHWIKKYPNTNVMYDGIFKDNHPVGEFKRFYESSVLKSVLIYSGDGKEAIATIYHENGYISSKGTFINQLKEGKWQFFSEFTKGYNVSEEFYTGNIKNGPALKFYPDSTVAERLTYKNDIPEGQCIQYYPDGSLSMKSNYSNGKFNGRFEVWFPNGQIEFSGQYKNDVRDGQWLIYKNDGTVKYKITYIDGVTKDRQMDIDQSDYLDSLEKNKGKIADPEKSGVMW
jgi:antitoxin component YwqK of YwqJK toxin-antitoxin module